MASRPLPQLPMWQIICMGDAESGKTSTVKTLLGTNDLQDISLERFGKQLAVLDAPGFYTEQYEAFSKHLKDTPQHAVLLVFKIGRFYEEQIRIATTFLAAEDIHKFTVVILTYRDHLFDPDSEMEMPVSKYIDESPEELKALIDRCGNRVVAINNRDRQKKENYSQGIYDEISKMIERNKYETCDVSTLKFPPVDIKEVPDEDAYRIVLIGHYEAGKTSTGNLLLGKRILDESTSQTEKPVETLGHKIKVFETPGLQNPSKDLHQIYKEIIETVALTKPGPHVFLMVTKIGRFTDEQRNTVEELIKEFGHEIFRYMIVVFTFKDHLFDPDTEQEMDIGRYIKGSPKELQKLVETCGYRCVAVNNRSKTDRQEQAQELLNVISTLIESNHRSYYKHEKLQKIYDTSTVAKYGKLPSSSSSKSGQVQKPGKGFAGKGKVVSDKDQYIAELEEENAWLRTTIARRSVCLIL